MTEIRCLSLWQPWASLMAVGAKKIETRSWATDYTGLVAIHAAKKWTGELKDILGTEPFHSALDAEIVRLARRRQPTLLPLGAIVGLGYLKACYRTEYLRRHPDVYGLTEREEAFGDFSDGRFGWCFQNIFAFVEPIPMKGQQGLWTLDPETTMVVQTARSVLT